MMQTAVDEMVFRLLRKKSLAETSVQQLEDLVQDYPYFPLTRFLLARKALENNLPQQEEWLEKAAVFMPDVHWLQYALKDGIEYGSNLGEEEEEKDEYGEETYTADTKEERLLEEEPLENELPEEDFATEEETVPASVAQEDIPALEMAIPTPEETPAPEEYPATPAPMERAMPEQTALKAAIAGLNTAEPSPSTQEAVIPLDPYHSIDYFASQGIRLRNEELGKDQMGRQLKKFTEWLKTMKKIPASESTADIDDATNQNIQNIAAHSISGTEIVTEAMAEVLVKQRRYDKAIEVYRKLSLLNPAKSTYFASLIEDLNKQFS